jgi:sialidase-1
MKTATLLLCFCYLTSRTIWALAAEPIIFTIAPADETRVRQSEGTAVELADGRLLLAWIEFVQGPGGDSDFFPARIVAKTSRDGGRTWDGYRVLAKPEEGEISAFSPNLLRLTDGRLLFVYMRYLSFEKAKHKYPPATTVALVSDDEGETFAPLATIAEEEPITICNHTLKQLASGRILLPLNRDASEDRQVDHFQAGIAYSDDGGKTWRRSETWVDAPKRGAMEPHVAESAPNQVLMIMRTQAGTIYQSRSKDGGETWSPGESLGVESPESCPELLSIPGTSDLLLIYNAAKYDPAWASHFGKRTPLSAAISKDGGKTWSAPKHIETDPTFAFSNPGAYFLNNGDLFVNYWVSKYTEQGFMSNFPIELKGAIVEGAWLYGE